MEALASGTYSFVAPTKLRRDAPRELDEWFEAITAYDATHRFVDASKQRLLCWATALSCRVSAFSRSFLADLRSSAKSTSSSPWL